MQSLEPRLPQLVAQFYRNLEHQRRRDAETVASLCRVLKSGGGGELIELLRSIVHTEIQENTHDHDNELRRDDCSRA